MADEEESSAESLSSGADSSSLSLSLPDSFLAAELLPPVEFAPLAVPLTGFQAELSHMKSSRDALEEALRREKENAREKVLELQEQHSGALETLRKERHSLENEVAGLRRQLSLQRSDFEDLEVSDAYAAEIARLPVEGLSLKDWICQRLHGVVAPLRRQLEQTRKSLQDTRAETGALAEAAEAAQREAARAKRMADGREDGLKLELQSAVAQADTLGKRAKDAEAHIEVIEDKERRYDKLAAAHEMAKEELDGLRSTRGEQAQSIAALTESLKEANTRAADLDQKVLNLSIDKDYLERSLKEAQLRADRSEARAIQLDDEKRGVERRRAEAVEALMDYQRHAQADYDRRLQEEVNRMRTEAESTAQIAQNGMREAAERETSTLKELNAEYQRERDHWRLRSEEMSSQMEEVRRSLQEAASSAEKRATQAEAREKMRVFEASQLGVRLEAETMELRRARAEVDMLRQKALVLEKEFQTLRMETDQDINSLTAELERERQKTVMYETLELEIDSTVLRTAEGTLKVGGGGSTEAMSQVDLAVSSAVSAPSARVRQAVKLAQRLLQKEGENESLQFKIEELSQTLQVIQQKLEAANTALDQVQNPQKLIIQALRLAEEEKRQLQQRLADARSEVKDALEEAASKDEEIKRLKEDVETMLEQQERLDAMQAALSGLRPEVQNPREDTRGRSGESHGTGPDESAFHREVERRQAVAPAVPGPGMREFTPSRGERDLNFGATSDIKSPQSAYSLSHSRTVFPGTTMHQMFVKHGSDT